MYKSNWRIEKERYQKETNLMALNLIIFLTLAILWANYQGINVIL